MNLQELRRKIYLTAKSDKKKRFWGLYCHITKMEVLLKAYKEVKQNKGSAGIDKQTFEDIEEYGIHKFLIEIKESLENQTYRPERNKTVYIPKENGKLRKLGIPTIKDRVVQAAVKIIIEPIFEADFSGKSYGYRPKRNQHQVIVKVSQAITRRFTKVIDVDLSAYFDNIDHEILMSKIKKRIKDDKVIGLIGKMLKSVGRCGVQQGGVISPLFSNIYLTGIDKMFERAIRETMHKGYEQLDYYRFADDMVILVNGHESLSWLVKKAMKRLEQEITNLKVQLNKEKTKIVNMDKDETFDFLGFTYRKIKHQTRSKGMVKMVPKKKKVQNLVSKVRNIIKQHKGQKKCIMIAELNDVLRGWLNYYRIGHCSKIFWKIRNWVEKKVRRFVRKAQKKSGFGWKSWSREVIYDKWKLYGNYRIKYYSESAPAK